MANQCGPIRKRRRGPKFKRRRTPLGNVQGNRSDGPGGGRQRFAKATRER